MLTSVRHSIRSLLRAPVFTTVAILFLALGIGGSVSVFAIARAVTSTPAVSEPDRLIEIWSTQSPASRQRVDWVPGTRMSAWAELSFRSLEGLAARASRSFVLAGDVPERIPGELATSTMFEVLGVRARLGRVFEAADGRVGAEPAVIISEGLWKSRFGQDPSVLGRSLDLSGEVYSIVGVMPRAFDPGLKVWVPAEGRLGPGDFGLPIGRLRTDISISEAAAEIQYLAAAEIAADSSAFGGMGAVAVPLGTGAQTTAQNATVSVLVGIAGAILLLSLANLTTLFMARASKRGRATALRVALGASPLRLGTGLLGEGVLLAAAGGGLGLILAHSTMGLMRAAVGDIVVVPYGLGLDVTLVIFVVVLAFACAVALGLEPLRLANRVDVRLLLHGGDVSGGPFAMSERRGRILVIAIQVGLTTVLICTAVVLSAAYENWARVDVGYDAARIVAAFPDYDVAEMTDDEQWILGSVVTRRMSADPSVEEVTLWRHGTTVYPSRPEHAAVFDGGATDFHARLGLYHYYHVGADFFRTMGIPVVSGRAFGPTDGPGSPLVGIVSESGAGAWWPEQNPVGRQLKLGESGEWITIIGVAEDAAALTPYGRMFSTAALPVGDYYELPQLYLAASQGTATPLGWRIGGAALGLDGVVVGARARDEPGAVITALTREMTAGAPGLPIGEVETLLDIQLGNGSTRAQAVYSRLVRVAGMCGTLLALLGIVAGVAHAAVRTTREMGIRSALGARDHQLHLLLIRDGVVSTIVGLAVGVIVLLVISDAASSLLGDLQGASFTDWRTLSLVGGALLTITIGTAFAIARRVAQVDPAVALRSE